MPIIPFFRQLQMPQSLSQVVKTKRGAKDALSVLVLALCIAWYATLLTLFWFHAPIKQLEPGAGGHLLGLTFNSMMDHLLHGRFDVDPLIVGHEGFLRDGKVYAYWGIFPALLRLPVLWLPHGLNMDVTRLSCMVAASLMFLINYKSWRYLNNFALSTYPWLSLCLFLTLAFSGAQICFLNSTLYQEVCLWGLVFAVWFVHWAMRACLDSRQIPSALPRMALASGLALITRVSFGVGLYGAFGLIALAVLWQFRSEIFSKQYKISALIAKSIIVKPLFGSAFILMFFMGVTAFVNNERWGNPLTFANYHLYLTTDFARSMQNGLFSLQRVPLGLMYFFFPVWVVQWPTGHFIFENEIYRLLYSAELPPSSFFLTDGFLFFLSGLFLFFVAKQKCINRPLAIAAVLGLLSAPLLMLMAVAMNFRYRGEFYPPMLFMAFMGVAILAQNRQMVIRLKKISVVLVCMSVIMSHAALVLYDLSDLGPSQGYLSQGVLTYYAHRVHRTNDQIHNIKIQD